MKAYIGVGANLGDARANVADAVLRLDRMQDSAVEQMSSLYRSAPIDSSGDDYVNAVVRIVTYLEAYELLAALHRIEAEHGRERPYRNAPRTLDLDLLLYDDQQIGTPLLQVPHPRLHQRAFVLVPLLELAPHIEIPGLGPARQFSAAVADQAITKIT